MLKVYGIFFTWAIIIENNTPSIYHIKGMKNLNVFIDGATFIATKITRRAFIKRVGKMFLRDMPSRIT